MFYNDSFALSTHFLNHNPQFCFTILLPIQNYHNPFLTQNFIKKVAIQSEAALEAKQMIKQEQTLAKIQQNLQSVQNNSLKRLRLFQNHCISIKKSIKNHNVLPNMVKSILSHIRRPSKTGKKVMRILNKYKKGDDTPNQLLAKYYSYQNYLYSKIPKSKHQNSFRFIITHLDPKLETFTTQEQLFYNKVSRILIYNLLHEDFLLSFLSNRKYSRSSKDDHLRAKLLLTTLLKENGNSQNF